MSEAAESISRKLSTAFRHDLRSWIAPVQAPGMTYDHLLQLQGEAPCRSHRQVPQHSALLVQMPCCSRGQTPVSE